MFPRFFAPAFLLLAFAVHSALGTIFGIDVPTNVIHPGDTFPVTFHTLKENTVALDFFVLFGLSPGTTPPPDGTMGPVVLTGQGSDLAANGHSQTGTGEFNVYVHLPKSFKTGKSNQRYTFSIAFYYTTGTLHATQMSLPIRETITIGPK